ncbi:hypothetical protein B0H11DRAFT_1907474 [Mycena galericulata]|nr:hypothetical protein B0H11DRAFT_1907474 [Mycena galericulata]
MHYNTASATSSTMMKLILLVDSKSGLRSFIWARPPSIRRRRVRRLVRWDEGTSTGGGGLASRPRILDLEERARERNQWVGSTDFTACGNRDGTEGNVRGPYVSYPTCILQYSHGSICSMRGMDYALRRNSRLRVKVEPTPNRTTRLNPSIRDSTTRKNPVQTRQMRYEDAAGVELDSESERRLRAGTIYKLQSCAALNEQGSGLVEEALPAIAGSAARPRRLLAIIYQCSDHGRPLPSVTICSQ